MKIWTDKRIASAYLQHSEFNEPKTFVSTDDVEKIPLLKEVRPAVTDWTKNENHLYRMGWNDAINQLKQQIKQGADPAEVDGAYK